MHAFPFRTVRRMLSATTIAAITLVFATVGAAEDAKTGGPTVKDYDAKQTADEKSGAAKTATTDQADLAEQLKILNEQLETLRKQVASLQADRGDLELLQKKVNVLESDTGAFANRLHEMEMNGGKASVDSLLGTMNTDLTARRELQRALYVNAGVRFYNWEGKPVRINVNGTWHTLRKGENSILVSYGPVTIHRWDDAPARIFNDWKAYKNGFVMEFDVGLETAAK